MQIDCLLVVEDDPSEAVMRRVVDHTACGLHVASVLPKRGNQPIRNGIPRYRSASHVIPHLILTDLDQTQCPVTLLTEWDARNLPTRVMFRIAVRSVEAWLMADADTAAVFLGIPASRLPARPEDETNPKQTLLNLARRSKSTRFVSEFVPAKGSVASQGPLYNVHLCRYVREHWRAEFAAQRAPSLERSLRRLYEWQKHLLTA